MVKKRSIRCYQRMMAPKSDGMTCQLPLTLFLEPGTETDDGIRIAIHHSPAMNMCVPYLAASDRFGKSAPLELDGTRFPEIAQDTPALRGLKMREFRLHLPPAIASQYRFAALMRIPGFDRVLAIESGSVVRELFARYRKRIMLAAAEWRLVGRRAEPVKTCA